MTDRNTIIIIFLIIASILIVYNICNTSDLVIYRVMNSSRVKASWPWGDDEEYPNLESSLSGKYNHKGYKHPSQMTTEELEDRVALDGLSVGPGLVQSYRYRGNLNL